MHEFSFASHIADVVMQNVHKNNVNKVLSIDVEIGQFTMIIPESLRYCYDVIKQSHPELKGSTMNIRTVPGSVKCKDCGAVTEFAVEAPGETETTLPVLHAGMFTCGTCGKGNTEINGGRQALIKSMKVDS